MPLPEGSAIGVLQGTRTYLLQDDAGNVLPTHSVSAGLDYPAVGPEHALLHDEGRVEYASVRDEQALAAFHLLGEDEGILPALESAHALAWLVREAASLKGRTVILNVSGRGDKDLEILDSGELRSPLPESKAAPPPPEPPVGISEVPMAGAGGASLPENPAPPRGGSEDGGGRS